MGPHDQNPCCLVQLTKKHIMKIKFLALYISLFLSNLSLAMDIKCFSTLDGFPVPAAFGDNNAVVHRGNYIVPNEFNPGTQFEALEDAEGLMISVGSIRTLVIYGWAKGITHLLALDYDSHIIAFNRKHFDFILQLNATYSYDVFLQRFQYVCFLHGRAFKGELSQDERATTNIVLLVRDFMKNKDSRLERDCSKDGDFEQLQFQNECVVGVPWASNLFQYKPAPNNSGGYYWEDDKQWLKIVDGLKNNKIAVATADLSNDTQMTILSDYIKLTTLNFALFDKSNTPKISEQLLPADIVLYSESIACQFQNNWIRNKIYSSL